MQSADGRKNAIRKTNPYFWGEREETGMEFLHPKNQYSSPDTKENQIQNCIFFYHCANNLGFIFKAYSQPYIRWKS